MKRFFAGAVLGWLTFALLAQRPSDKIVPPQIAVDNAKVKVSRWVLQPGERSPVHTHTLDHVYVVVHGSKITVRSHQIRIPDSPGSYLLLAAHRHHRIHELARNCAAPPLRVLLEKIR